MKKKISLIILLLFLTIIFTGCTKYIKDDNKKIVKNEETGQNIVENILCRPEAKKTLEVYEEYKIDISKLPKCSNFKVNSGGYEGIWNTLFVKPLAWILLKIGYLVKNFGLSIIIVTFLIRLILVPITKNATTQSENMKKVKPEMDKLEAKYKNKNDQESMMQKSQEMLVLYKKYNINPLTGCLFAFIQIPLFMSFFEALYRLPAIFEGKFGPFQLGTTPLIAITSGKYWYIILSILVFAVTFYSFKFNGMGAMNKDQEKQMKMMKNISFILIGITSFTVSSAICIYWIINSGFTVIQNLYMKMEKKK